MHAVLECGWVSGQQWQKHMLLVLNWVHEHSAPACHASARATSCLNARSGTRGLQLQRLDALPHPMRTACLAALHMP